MQNYSTTHRRTLYAGIWIWETKGIYYFFDENLERYEFKTLKEAQKAVKETL